MYKNLHFKPGLNVCFLSVKMLNRKLSLNGLSGAISQFIIVDYVNQ